HGVGAGPFPVQRAVVQSTEKPLRTGFCTRNACKSACFQAFSVSAGLRRFKQMGEIDGYKSKTAAAPKATSRRPTAIKVATATAATPLAATQLDQLGAVRGAASLESLPLLAARPAILHHHSIQYLPDPGAG